MGTAPETIILLARHGETDWNRERRWQGHADRPLNKRGREQTRRLVERLRPVSLEGVYASDLARARDTAAAVAKAARLELRTAAGLREVDAGSWSGLTRDEARALHPEGYARWLAGEPGWSDGETYEQMSERVLRTIGAIAAAHAGGLVLVVTHAGPIRAVHAQTLAVDIASYRRMRPVEPNARLSAACCAAGRLTRLCGTDELRAILEPEELERGPRVPAETASPGG